MLAKLKGQQLIQPPPDIKQIADRTAQYVAKNGPQFEDLVAKAEKDNAKFSFLKLGDPYRAYYDSKIYEYSRGLQTEKVQQATTGGTSATQQLNPVQQNMQKLLKKNIDLKPPQVDKFNVDFNRQITALELDLIRHCAQFVAKNGQKFLVALTEREKANVQFDFLKPTHPLFSFFTSLVDSYNNCLNPKKEDILQLQENVQNKMSIFKRASERWEWESMEKASRKKKQEIDEEEKIQMAQIDWNDFVIVETIDLLDEDQILTSQDQASRDIAQPHQPAGPLLQKAIEPVHPQIQPQPIQPAPIQQIQQQEQKPKNIYMEQNDIQKVKCQVCGQNIPVNEYDEHVKLELLDPNYFKIKNQISQRVQNTTTASNQDFSKNLINFSQKRQDYYGNQVPEDQSQKPDIWDGQAANMTRATAAIAMLANKQNKNIKELFENVNIVNKQSVVQQEEKYQNMGQQQQQQMHINPLLSAISLQPQQIQPIMQPIQPFLPQNIEQQEPTFNLIPEHQWAQKFQGPIKINVKVPESYEEENWNLKGQVIQLQLDITTTIETIKNTLTGLLGGLPLQKMKLRTFNISNMKENLSLAYYNISPNNQLDLQLKERGGVRKNK